MKDQLLAIAILCGTAFGLFWIRHLVLTVAKRQSHAVQINDNDPHGDDVADDEPTPIAWLTTTDIEPSPNAEFMEAAPAGIQHPAKPHPVSR